MKKICVMNKEQIIKAAKEAEEEMAERFMQDENFQPTFTNAFMTGAKWQRNSVWHKMADEEPQVHGAYENQHYPQIPCLVHGYLATGYGYGVRFWNITEKCWDDEECDDYECDKNAIEEWAYLDDLLPTEGGDE